MATIRKRNGRYQAQVRIAGSAPLSKTFNKKQEARQWANALELEVISGAIGTITKTTIKITLRDLLARYKQEVTPTKRGFWREEYAILAMNRHQISSKFIGEVNERDAACYRDDRLKLVKSSTVNREIALFRHAYEVARRDWGIPVKGNPFAEVKKPKNPNARTRRLEVGEWNILSGACEKSRNKQVILITRIALETAMRRGEILAIEKKHLNETKRTLLIPHTKNGCEREIPLNASAFQILSNLASGLELDDRLFSTSEIAFRMAWRVVMKRAQLRDLHFHDLRREAISRFLEQGLGVPEVALISGHKCYKMLYRYVKLRPENIALKLSVLSNDVD